MPENWQRAGFGLYIHWPFCQAKCPYCDFNSHVWNSIDQAQWADAFCDQIGRQSDGTQDRVLTSVFFGGGTPSLMKPATVQSILDRVRSIWNLANDCEITLEANPTSVEAKNFAGYADAGVNRVSIGVQALNDRDLKALGRLHTRDEGITAIETARSSFDRMSFDLIYARQNQSLDDWEHELSAALSLNPDHLSLYQLTIEPETAFGRLHASGRLRNLPTEDLSADMFQMTRALTEKAGLPAYETSNHAMPGEESRHNLIYWRGGDYLGVGPGAHGRLSFGSGRLATTSPKQPGTWLKMVKQGQNAVVENEHLSLNDQVSEYIMMALRTVEGAEVTKIEELDAKFADRIVSGQGMLSEYLSFDAYHGRISIKPEFHILANSVISEVLR